VRILYGLDLPDVFDLDGMHDLDIVAEVVQIVDRLILIRVAPSERVRLGGVGLRLLVLGCQQLVLSCQASLLVGVQGQVWVRVREA
jgi:hypothetical protein